MSGAYCKRHEEYSHTGVCRWCPSEAEQGASFKSAYAVATPVPQPSIQVLTGGKNGFPKDAFDAKSNTTFYWPWCKCQAFLTADDCPWFEDGVRHTPSGCA